MPRKGGLSEVAKLYGIAAEYLSESHLVSAFDLHHGFLEFPTAQLTSLTVLDSGGYEVASYDDLSAASYELSGKDDWSREMHGQLVARWPGSIPAVVVTYDSTERLALKTQIDYARALKATAPNQWITLLIKPETQDQNLIQFKSVAGLVDELTDVDVIGVTEKELGTSALDRMVMVARLRRLLDANKVDAPLHIFGCLDPLSVPLMFLAGAEIFDGLGWIRYGFDDAGALYRQNFATLSIGIDRRDDFIRLRTLQSNLEYMRDLTNRLVRFAGSGDFANFGEHEVLFTEATELLASRLKED